MNAQYMEHLNRLWDFIRSKNGKGDKELLESQAQSAFGLTKDRKVYYNEYFAVRFSQVKNEGSFANTVLSLSALQKYDAKPFVVCIVGPSFNVLRLANTTFLRKISHSSQELAEDNIKGSFNGTDIMKEVEVGAEAIPNEPRFFGRLFPIHQSVEFNENLRRLVEATSKIVPTGQRAELDAVALGHVFHAPHRANAFVGSCSYSELKRELDDTVARYQDVILLASLIENVNLRGRVIEYLIAGKDEALKAEVISVLRGSRSTIPKLATENALGDYLKTFPDYDTATDIKTKIMYLDSNPKAYNIDKMLAFLGSQKSVFLFYFVGIDLSDVLAPRLVSMFNDSVLRSTLVLRHWAGRNSRGVTQLEGAKIKELLLNDADQNSNIDFDNSSAFLNRLVQL